MEKTFYKKLGIRIKALREQFEYSQDISSILERCAVYDVGARAFDRNNYFKDLNMYWRSLIKCGKTVSELYSLKWDFSNITFAEYEKKKTAVWPEVTVSFLKKLYRKEKRRLKRVTKMNSREFIKRRFKCLKSISAQGSVVGEKWKCSRMKK